MCIIVHDFTRLIVHYRTGVSTCYDSSISLTKTISLLLQQKSVNHGCSHFLKMMSLQNRERIVLYPCIYLHWINTSSFLWPEFSKHPVYELLRNLSAMYRCYRQISRSTQFFSNVAKQTFETQWNAWLGYVIHTRCMSTPRRHRMGSLYTSRHSTSYSGAHR